MQLNPNDTRMRYDKSSYQEQLERSIFPGVYKLVTPHNDCDDCSQYAPNDPHIRYQSYGHHTCSMKKAVDDSSELYGLNYKNSKCNSDAYAPNSYISTGCVPRTIDVYQIEDINEADKKNPPIGKPKRGGSGGKKYYVYVRDPKTKRIKKVSFGDAGNLRTKINDPKARRAFAARHKCAQKTDRTKPSYWSCRIGRYWKQLGGSNNFSGFW